MMEKFFLCLFCKGEVECMQMDQYSSRWKTLLFFSQEEKETLTDLDNRMWDPELQIPVEFRNLEPIWRKLNKVCM